MSARIVKVWLSKEENLHFKKEIQVWYLDSEHFSPCWWIIIQSFTELSEALTIYQCVLFHPAFLNRREKTACFLFLTLIFIATLNIWKCNLNVLMGSLMNVVLCSRRLRHGSGNGPLTWSSKDGRQRILRRKGRLPQSHEIFIGFFLLLFFIA